VSDGMEDQNIIQLSLYTKTNHEHLKLESPQEAVRC
jgi:hypothetical protein